MRASELNVGDKVWLTAQTYFTGPGEYPEYRYEGINDVEVEVAKVFTKSAQVVVPEGTFTRNYTRASPTEYPVTVSVPVERLYRSDVQQQKQKPGEPPEGMIDPNDPKLAWFWRQVSQYVERRRLCSDYDKLVEYFGVPGRYKDRKITREVGDTTITIIVKACSDQEASDLADEAFKKMVTEMTES